MVFDHQNRGFYPRIMDYRINRLACLGESAVKTMLEMPPSMAVRFLCVCVFFLQIYIRKWFAVLEASSHFPSGPLVGMYLDM